MSVLLIAHRAGNDPASLRAAGRGGADLAEADVHLRRGRLELRHAKSLGPLPVHWEPWYLVRPTGVVLADLVPHLGGAPRLLLDLKGWQPWLGRRVRDAMAATAPGVPYTVCTRRWHLLDAFAGLAHVDVVRSVRTARELRRLPARPTWGVALHRDLVTAPVVAGLLQHAHTVLTWPVDGPDDAARAVRAGARGLISDDLATVGPVDAE